MLNVATLNGDTAVVFELGTGSLIRVTSNRNGEVVFSSTDGSFEVSEPQSDVSVVTFSPSNDD